jgi:hypothetical protein
MSRKIQAEGRSTALPAASNAARSSGDNLILNGDGFLAGAVVERGRPGPRLISAITNFSSTPNIAHPTVNYKGVQKIFLKALGEPLTGFMAFGYVTD